MDGVIWAIMFTSIGRQKRKPESIKPNVDAVRMGRDAIQIPWATKTVNGPKGLKTLRMQRMTQGNYTREGVSN
jgi:hypothetical protein